MNFLERLPFLRYFVIAAGYHAVVLFLLSFGLLHQDFCAGNNFFTGKYLCTVKHPFVQGCKFCIGEYFYTVKHIFVQGRDLCNAKYIFVL